MLETRVSDPDEHSAVPYDLSEAALKKLYREADDDAFYQTTNLINEAEKWFEFDVKNEADSEPNAGLRPEDGNRKRSDDSQAAALGVAYSTRLPPDLMPEKPAAPVVGGDVSDRRSVRPRVVAIALIAIVLLLVCVASSNSIRMRFSAYFPRSSPSMTGVLHAAELAAGHEINPGETYSVDIPQSNVQIAVLSGQVALASKNGASLRPCSNQPFVVKAADGSSGLANPFVSSCGGAPSFIQAVIPQPPLPSPVP
jgi:ferric-dicitrate binding protein FerR (iron transport regulator)